MPVTTFDDRSSAIVYSGLWDQGGTPREHEGTVSSSMTPGASFTLTFTGTRLSVLGTLDASSDGVQTSYSIDGAKPETVTHRASGEVFKTRFWRSPLLATNGEHKLTVTMIKTNPTDQPFQGTVWFDLIQTNDEATSSSSNPPPSTNPSPSATNSGTSTIDGVTYVSGSKISAPTSAASDTADNASVDNGGKKGTNIAPIVGGVIAALLVLLGITAIFLVRRHRKRRRIAAYVDGLGGEKGGASAGSTPGSLPSNPSSYPFTANNLNAAVPWTTQPQARPHPPGHPPHLPPGAGGPVHLAYSSYAPSHTHNNSISNSLPGVTTTSSSSGVGAPSQSFGRLVIANANTQQGEDPDSIAALKRRQQATIASNSNSNLPSMSSSSSNAAASTVEDPDSISALKRRQQAYVDSYDAGLQQGGSAGQGEGVVQHMDSGIRNVPMELPPVYSAA